MSGLVTWLVSGALGWQDVAAAVVVALAVAFLVDRFFLSARRKQRARPNTPDVPVGSLVRKRPKDPSQSD